MMSEPDRQHFALREADHVYPTLSETIEGGTSKSWDQDPWARGGYSVYAPGTLKAISPLIAKPEGRLHFAGEHTVPLYWHASVQGAIQSGLRAARGIHEAT